TPLRVHGPEPCASANSATSASDFLRGGGAALKEDAAPSILTRRELSVKPSPSTPMTAPKQRSSKSKQSEVQKMPGQHSAKTQREQPDNVTRLRTLAHDLSNSLEAIMQAAYLLGQGKLDGDAKRWAQLIDKSSQDAARI